MKEQIILNERSAKVGDKFRHISGSIFTVTKIEELKTELIVGYFEGNNRMYRYSPEHFFTILGKTTKYYLFEKLS